MNSKRRVANAALDRLGGKGLEPSGDDDRRVRAVLAYLKVTTPQLAPTSAAPANE